jgi:diacylglycerol kinase family enzyme
VARQVLAGRLRNINTSLDQPVIYFQTEKIKIENINNAPMHIDGDPAETPDKLVIEIKKKCFRLIQPI